MSAGTPGTWTSACGLGLQLGLGRAGPLDWIALRHSSPLYSPATQLGDIVGTFTVSGSSMLGLFSEDLKNPETFKLAVKCMLCSLKVIDYETYSVGINWGAVRTEL